MLFFFMEKPFQNILLVTKEWLKASLSELYIMSTLVLIHDVLKCQLESKASDKNFTRLRIFKYLLLGHLNTMPPYFSLKNLGKRNTER
jgi:hypothetical protein